MGVCAFRLKETCPDELAGRPLCSQGPWEELARRRWCRRDRRYICRGCKRGMFAHRKQILPDELAGRPPLSIWTLERACKTPVVQLAGDLSGAFKNRLGGSRRLARHIAQRGNIRQRHDAFWTGQICLRLRGDLSGAFKNSVGGSRRSAQPIAQIGGSRKQEAEGSNLFAPLRRSFRRVQELCWR